MKSKGPNIEPWGTPTFILLLGEVYHYIIIITPIIMIIIIISKMAQKFEADIFIDHSYHMVPKYNIHHSLWDYLISDWIGQNLATL